MFSKLFTYFQRSWTKFGLGRRIVWKLFKLSVSFLSQGCSLVFLNGIFADSSKIHPIFACVSVCKSMPDICHFCYTFWGLKMLLHPKVRKSATKQSNPRKYIFVFVFVFVFVTSDILILYYFFTLYFWPDFFNLSHSCMKYKSPGGLWDADDDCCEPR